MTVVLGLDVGERRIGVAIGDTGTRHVRPLRTLRRSTAEREAAALRALVEEQGATELVVGLPLDCGGGIGPQAASVQAWAADVAAVVGVAVTWRDERHTTQAAEARVGAAPRGRTGGPPSAPARRAHRARIDREAAASILQAELDGRAGVGA